MGRTHNVLFNFGVGRTDLVNLSENFYVKWSNHLPENKAFLMTYTFLGTISDLTLYNDTVPNLFINFGDRKVSIAGGEFSGNQARPSTIVGMLQWVNTLQGEVYATTKTNPAVYLPHRPTNELVQIFIRKNIDEYQLDTGIYLGVGQWTLTMSFEEIDDE